jgi:hypothetical protein
LFLIRDMVSGKDFLQPSFCCELGY